MNKYYILLLILIVFSSCKNYLDVVPDNVATLEYAFRDKVGAEKFLASCYTYLPSAGDVFSDPGIMASDESWTFENYFDMSNYNAFFIKSGLQTSNNPYLDYWSGLNNGSRLYQGIRNCNIFIESADNVGPELEGAEKDRWVAEAKFLKAYYHFYLLRMYGPVPIIRENLPVSAGTEDVRVYREPFDDCVQYVSDLIDEALPHLPLSIVETTTEQGRITQPIALSVKAELLVLAASPLFNGNDEYASISDDRGVALFPASYDRKKWEIAAEACKTAIESAEAAGHKLYHFEDQSYILSDTTRTIQSVRCVVSDRWNDEIIWGNTRNSAHNYQFFSLPFFTTDNVSKVPWRGMIAPTIRMAELFYSNNGVPIQEDVEWESRYDNRFKTEAAPVNHFYYVQPNFKTAIINLYREPRFYANLAFDGCYWYGNGRYKDVGKGSAAETSWPIRMKLGETSGKNGSMRYSVTGYWAKKPSHYQSSVNSSGGAAFVRYAFPVIRLADLYLLYAEALNESLNAPDTEVYEYVDRIRERAGLEGIVESWAAFSKFPQKPTSTEGMRDIIQRERMIELCFEGKRFWDLRRWKRAMEEYNKPIRAWNIEGTTEIEYYQMLTIADLSYTTRDYLWPIRDHDIRVNRNLIQNPYW